MQNIDTLIKVIQYENVVTLVPRFLHAFYEVVRSEIDILLDL